MIRSKKDAENALRDAGECSFRTQNLENIGSLRALGDYLPNIRQDVFDFHTGNGYNHFSIWIKEVFGDDKLAKDILSLSKSEMASVVQKRIAWLEKKAKITQ